MSRPGRTLLTVMVICAGLSPAAVAQEAGGRIVLPDRGDLHLYLLMGGENMSGRGEVREADRRLSERVVKLDKKGQWVWAQEPLHFDEPKSTGVGPGLAFARTMSGRFETIWVGLVPCAVGGAPLSRWEKGGDLYGQALRRARLAAKDGTLKGVLWHHGENDARDRIDAATYGLRLERMIGDLRKDLGRPTLPFVVAKLPPFVRLSRMPYAKRINESLEKLPVEVPHTACVETRGLERGRHLDHFSNKSARELGGRYYAAMIRLLLKLGEGDYDVVK